MRNNNLLDPSTDDEEDKKQKLIEFCKNYYTENGKGPKTKQFEELGITKNDLYQLFGGLSNLYSLLEIPIKNRKRNMTDDELKVYLISIKDSLSEDYDSLPSHRSEKSICNKVCTCWITSKFYASPKRGYAQIQYKGKIVKLHRLSYMLFKGNIPLNMIVSHKCDNPSCYNPEHLELKTQKENMADCIKRNRRIYDNQKSADTRLDRKDIKITDSNDYENILKLIKKRITISEKGEWLYNKGTTIDGYPEIWINGVKYFLHRLVLANKLGKNYEDINIARHILPDGSQPSKNDVNPDHLFEGDKSDNARDALSHRKCNQLTVEQVIKLRQELKNFDFTKNKVGIFDKNMAEQFNVAIDIIADARKGRTYKEYGVIDEKNKT